MLPIYLVAVIVEGNDGWRVLVALPSSQVKETLLHFLKDELDASTDGDWYVVATVAAGNAVIEKGNELGGHSFGLN